MKDSIIWHVSSNSNFPLELWTHPKFKITLKNVKLEDVEHIDFNIDTINLVYLNLTLKEWNQIKPNFNQLFNHQSAIHYTLIASVNPKEQIPAESSKGNYEFLEAPLHKRELRLIVDRILQCEYYRASAIEIGQSCLSNVGFFSGIFDLAHKEFKDSQETIKAFESILEYENKVKLYNKHLNSAMDSVNDLKQVELLELHDRIKASEQLETLREQELKDALAIKEATEMALQYSRVEEIQMDKIIKAQDKLFRMNNDEIKKLYYENIELKKRLGIKVEE